MSVEKQIVKDFFHYVNMTAEEMKAWLDNPTSMNTGQPAEDGEPKGRKSGKEILEILHKKDKDFSEDEITHMKHVNAYNKRHLAQGPSKDPEHSKWRYSLMNWGCDPLKKPFGKLDHSKTSEDSEAKGKEEQPKSEKKPSSPKKGSAKEEENGGKTEEKPSSPQKRKSDKQAEDKDEKKQKTT